MPDQCFMSSRHFTVDKVCGGLGATTPHKLNRERQVVKRAMRKHEDGGGSAAGCGLGWGGVGDV